MANTFAVPPTPTREQIEAFRREHVISAHQGETAEAGLEPWAIEHNMVLRYLCSLALEREAFPPEARRSGCACELDEQGDLVVRWCALHAVLKDALEAFVKAEGDWLAQKSGMPPGFFDDPLSDAYKQAKAALADVSAVSPLRQKP